MNGLPYYKAYPRDFIEGTVRMRFELKGAYRLVLDAIYMHGGALPDDARYIAGLLGLSVRKWKALRDELVSLGKLEINGERLTNHRAEKELETSRTHQDKQAENARRPRKNRGLQKPRLSHTESETKNPPIIPPGGEERSSKTKPPPGEQTSSDGSNSADASGEKQNHPPNSARPPSATAAAFDEFWSAYPLKVGKGAARKRFEQAVKKAPAEEIIQGAQRFAAQCRANQTERQFIKHPQGWLSAERWADETLRNVVALPGQRRPSSSTSPATGKASESPCWQISTTTASAAICWPATKPKEGRGDE